MRAPVVEANPRQPDLLPAPRTGDPPAEIDLWAVVVHAREVDAETRNGFARRLRSAPLPGLLVLDTCHRVEVYGAGSIPSVVREAAPQGARWLQGWTAARHLVDVAVGLDSAVVGEDQILHQLREAAGAARANGPLPPELGRLVDVALAAGRRARSWLPARRPSLADAALGAAEGELAGKTVLVVGTGTMGRLLARAARDRGAICLVASRTPERAAALASEVGGQAVPFDPGAATADAHLVLVALGGPWPLGNEGAAALVAGRAAVVDLSAPPALSSTLIAHLGRRYHSIDDLAASPLDLAPALRRRLEAATQAAVADVRAWVERRAVADVGRELAERLEAERSAALAQLWHRLPSLGHEERAAIEAMTRHLTARFLRQPLARLARDGDDERIRLARELFGL
jgi:glutamyl-tRNA reductase